MSPTYPPNHASVSLNKIKNEDRIQICISNYSSNFTFYFPCKCTVGLSQICVNKNGGPAVKKTERGTPDMFAVNFRHFSDFHIM